MYTERSYVYSDSFVEATKQSYITGGASSVVSQDDLKNALTNFGMIGRREGNFTTSLLEDNRLLYDAEGNLAFSESELLMPAIDVSQYQASDVFLALEKQGYFEIRNPVVLYPDGRKAEAAGTFIIMRLGGE